MFIPCFLAWNSGASWARHIPRNSMDGFVFCFSRCLRTFATWFHAGRSVYAYNNGVVSKKGTGTTDLSNRNSNLHIELARCPGWRPTRWLGFFSWLTLLSTRPCKRWSNNEIHTKNLNVSKEIRWRSKSKKKPSAFDQLQASKKNRQHWRVATASTPRLPYTMILPSAFPWNGRSNDIEIPRAWNEKNFERATNLGKNNMFDDRYWKICTCFCTQSIRKPLLSLAVWRTQNLRGTAHQT